MEIDDSLAHVVLIKPKPIDELYIVLHWTYTVIMFSTKVSTINIFASPLYTFVPFAPSLHMSIIHVLSYIKLYIYNVYRFSVHYL